MIYFEVLIQAPFLSLQSSLICFLFVWLFFFFDFFICILSADPSAVWRCFPNPERATADWSGCRCSPLKSFSSLLVFFWKQTSFKKVSTHFSLSRIFLPNPAPNALLLRRTPNHKPASRLRGVLMDIVEPVDHVEEGEDSGEDHPGPLVDRVHIGQVWDVHLELRGPSS